jgi:uncharacterized lipoprotein YddW (UPF0748 family)
MGTQGLPPSPFYDPLAFMINETHKRGMEFHAWINPYRAVFNINKSSVAPSHISKLHPEWFLTYGDKKYFNPGLPQVWQHTNRIVRDLVSRYDIDAIHMDDYFYPYRIAGKEFPDEKTYQQNKRGLSKEDWRRSNCDTIVKQLYASIHQTKPGVQFGISPFGIWRNKSKDPRGSNTKGGQTNYDDLYADILLWLEKGDLLLVSKTNSNVIMRIALSTSPIAFGSLISSTYSKDEEIQKEAYKYFPKNMLNLLNQSSSSRSSS